VIVNRREAAAMLNLLRGIESPRCLAVPVGQDLPLDPNSYNWDSVALDPCLNRPVRDDFEAFFEREEWFRERRLPYRRGYLLYGPPGNGKTAVARIMACHPDVRAFTIDFGSDDLPNDALTHLFQIAGDQAPSLIIMEDMDRVAWQEDGARRGPRITLQHLLGCLDGFGSRDGVVVVATANDPARLDPAILRRPGRFDRVAPFPQPSPTLRRIYLERLAGGALDAAGIAEAASQSDRLSFAQIREAYILAGQMTFARGGEVGLEDLLAGLKRVRSEASEFLAMATAREVGFGSVGEVGAVRPASVPF
jgi:ATP-dependent 26S proteasome regulatory subunit